MCYLCPFQNDYLHCTTALGVPFFQLEAPYSIKPRFLHEARKNFPECFSHSGPAPLPIEEWEVHAKTRHNKTQHGAFGGELGEGVSGSIPDTILKLCSNSNWRDARVFKMKILPFPEASWNLRAIAFEEIFQKDWSHTPISCWIC